MTDSSKHYCEYGDTIRLPHDAAYRIAVINSHGRAVEERDICTTHHKQISDVLSSKNGSLRIIASYEDAERAIAACDLEGVDDNYVARVIAAIERDDPAITQWLTTGCTECSHAIGTDK